MKTNILVECPALIASVKIGVLDPLKYFSDRNLCKVKFIKTLDIKKRDIQWADVLITVRGCEGATVQLVNAAKKMGRKIIYYLDDDLLNVPIHAGSYKFFSSDDIQKNIIAIIKSSDILWGVNDRIRDKYLLTDCMRWVKNELPMVPKYIEKKDEVIKVLYAGSTDHTNLVRSVISPVIRQLANEFGEKVEFVFIGVDSGIKDLDNVINKKFYSNYNEYRSEVESGNYHLGLAIVGTESFYQYKYYNKFVEYASIGVLGIYSDCLLYQDIIKNGVNGYLCQNEEEMWYNTIKYLINNPSKIKTLVNNSYEILEKNFNPMVVFYSLSAQLPEIGSFKAPVVSLSDIPNLNAKYSFYIERVKYYYKKYSVLCVFVIIAKAIKVTNFRIRRK